MTTDILTLTRVAGEEKARQYLAMTPVTGRCWMVAGVGGHHESRRERHTIGEIPVHGGAGHPMATICD